MAAEGRMRDMKVCPRCREELPADLEFFAPRDRHGHLDGWCRACRSEDQVERYQRRKIERDPDRY